MENGVEVAVEVHEKGGEVVGLDEWKVVEGEEEAFEEAVEQLPQVKAVKASVNEEEVFVTPVMDSGVRGVHEGEMFEEVVEAVGDVDEAAVPDVLENSEDEQVLKEEGDTLAKIKAALPSGGKTYAEVLVENVHGDGYMEANGNETYVCEDAEQTGSLQEAGATLLYSGTKDNDVEKISEVCILGQPTAESMNSNGEFSNEDGDSEDTGTGLNSVFISDTDRELSGSEMIGSQDDDEVENSKLAVTDSELKEVNTPEHEITCDFVSVSTGFSDNLEKADTEISGEVRSTPVDVDCLNETSSAEEALRSTEKTISDHVLNGGDDVNSLSTYDVLEFPGGNSPLNDVGANLHEPVDVLTEVFNSGRLPPYENGEPAAEVLVHSEKSSDQTAENGDVANNHGSSGVELELKKLVDERPKHTSILDDKELDRQVSESALLHEQPKGVEIQDDTHTGSGIEVAPNNQAGLVVPEHNNMAVKDLRPTVGEIKDPERPSLETASSSDRSLNSTHLPVRPAGLGRAAPLLEPAPRAIQQPRVNGSLSQAQAQLVEEAANGENDENDETREKLQMIRVKFLRLAHRLGQTPHNVVVAQVLYRLGLAEQLRGRNGGRVGAFSFDRASAMAEQLEASGQEPLEFSCTIMVLGKTGVGKSATINSIFDEVKFGTDAFQLSTKKVQDVVGTVQGIKVRVIDTPGLLSSWADQSKNEKILDSVKRFTKKNPPDIVLYLDRLDMQSRDFGDLPLLKTITKVFGASIWFNAIVVLTHAASAPPDGPNGSASNYDTFVTQRSHVVQHAVRQAAGDMRLMNPVSLVENHSACRINRAGQRILPNGQVWKPHLLLLSFASKILAEANTLLKLQDGPPGKPFATRYRAPSLPYLLTSMLQSRPHLRLPEEQMGGDDSLDDDLEDSSGSDDDSENDQLPPFKPLTKEQLSKLSKAQKNYYFDELEYRELLLMKRQLKEEKLRRKMLKKMAAAAKDNPSDYKEPVEEDNSGAASVPVPMPDLALPASFDSDNPTHRYRFLDSSNPWLVRPVLETQGWDHDVGYEGVNVERSFIVKEKVPLSLSGQITKDKKDTNVQMEVASTLKHGKGKATSVGLEMQTVGKDVACTLRSESTFSSYTRNKATAGLSFTLLGDALSAGMKLEDKLTLGRRFGMVMTGGAITNKGDIAYGGSMEATLRDKNILGRSLSTLGLSIMDWHGDLAIGCNIQSQIPIGRYSNMIARANLNNKGSGQVSLRFNSTEQLQIALIALLPLLRKIFSHPQEMQY